MENKNEIWNELQSISPMLASISRVNVYSVPEGYFDSVVDTVMICVAEESALPEIPSSFSEADVPKGYFDSLAGNILDKIKKQEDELPAVFSSVNKEEKLFSSPANYFDGLAEDILNKIGKQEEELPVMFSSINKEEKLFSLPANYFDNLADNILNTIKGETEEESLSPVLAGLKKSNPYNIPATYFDQLPSEILKKANQSSGAKVIKMPMRTSIFKYAAAAVVTGALALGVYKFSNQTKTGDNPSPSLAKLDPSIEKGKVMDDQKFNETLNSLSADDIVNYLQKNGSEADVAALTSNVEETNLPAEEDYILDNNTLDKFLKEIETKTN